MIIYSTMRLVLIKLLRYLKIVGAHLWE